MLVFVVFPSCLPELRMEKAFFDLAVCVTFVFFYSLDDVSPSLLKEFPDPKSLLNNTISRSLGVNDLAQFIQYSCTESAGVKVRSQVPMGWRGASEHIMSIEG